MEQKGINQSQESQQHQQPSKRHTNKSELTSLWGVTFRCTHPPQDAKPRKIQLQIHISEKICQTKKPAKTASVSVRRHPRFRWPQFWISRWTGTIRIEPSPVKMDLNISVEAACCGQHSGVSKNRAKTPQNAWFISWKTL